MIEYELYRAEQSRAIDTHLIEHQGIAGYDLMERAAGAAYQALRRLWPRVRSIAVVCGAGNNAGDGWVLARLALADGIRVVVHSVRDPAALSGDAAYAAQDYQEAGGEWLAFTGEANFSTTSYSVDVIVDAVLGTGLSGPPRDAFAQAIRAMNASDVPVLSLDIPSGLDADTGIAYEPTVRAQHTVTFIAPKQGLYTGDAPACTGDVEFAGLVDETLVDHDQTAAGTLLSAALINTWIPRRTPVTHKGQAGHVVVTGGAEGMPGAVLMAGHAALRSGAGMVSVVTHPRHAAALAVYRPELMIHSWEAEQEWPTAVFQRANVVALGPGLGHGDWSQAVFERASRHSRHVVLDADGLNLLAAATNWQAQAQQQWIITPHPGEAGRLLQCDTAQIQSDRIGAAQELARRYQAVTVLKGAGTVIAQPHGDFAICPVACGALASAGMGDVLSGVLAALMAQGMGTWHAACGGVWLHAQAGLRAAQGRSRGVLATDLLTHLPDLIP